LNNFNFGDIAAVSDLEQVLGGAEVVTVMVL
jgi:hypothetical protein